MGLADALAMLGLDYGGENNTVQAVANIFRTLRDAAYMTSVSLAQEKGKAPVWDESDDYAESIVSNGFFATLPDYLRKLIIKHGTRNITLLSVAPTGTISNLFGVASGIEPLFAHQFSRRTRMTGVDQIIDYVQPGVRLSRAAGLPDSIWPTAYEVSPEDHVFIQAVAQQYIDQSISKTLNFPAGTSPADVGNAYLSGWSQGLKGMAVYVDGSREEQVLYKTVEHKEGCPSCGGEIAYKDGCKECMQCSC